MMTPSSGSVIARSAPSLPPPLLTKLQLPVAYSEFERLGMFMSAPASTRSRTSLRSPDTTAWCTGVKPERSSSSSAAPDRSSAVTASVLPAAAARASADIPAVSVPSTGFPAAISSWSTATLPADAASSMRLDGPPSISRTTSSSAISKGLRPLMSMTSGLAPAWSSSATHSLTFRLPRAAKCSGTVPRRLGRLGSAPTSRSALMASSWPWMDAMWMAACPSWLPRLTG
mmetsp:Transcript_13985/g.58398  ORF Transcript_13985/g.58398 Transcript_13985/m.58398 type:complete len:229 (-) Transcript_13985:223-909(-)